jgi:hypothetical protein
MTPSCDGYYYFKNKFGKMIPIQIWRNVCNQVMMKDISKPSGSGYLNSGSDELQNGQWFGPFF